MAEWLTLMQGDCRVRLRDLPTNSVHCVVTSPPYYGLRDYGVDSQIGLEPTPDAYVAELVAVCREIRRVLRDDGTLWLNLGDSYFGTGKGPTHPTGFHAGGNGTAYPTVGVYSHDTLKQKDLCGIPWRVAFALQADGWWLRQDIIWHKPNPMPESVTDRCTKAHEYLFLLAKQERYYYDAEAIKEDAVADGAGRNRRSVWTVTAEPYAEAHFATYPPALIEPCILAGTSERGCCPTCGAPWERVVETRPNPAGITGGRHREVARPDGIANRTGRDYDAESTAGQSRTVGWRPVCKCPPADPVPCTVLDPFNGAGTTGLVAIRNGRRYIGCELNPDYIELTRKRILDHEREYVGLTNGRVVESTDPLQMPLFAEGGSDG